MSTSAAPAVTIAGTQQSMSSDAAARIARRQQLLRRWGPSMVLVLALMFPFLDSVLGLNMMNPMLRILTSIMLAMGLNIVVGFAGLLDLGYVAFWAIGAYVVGWFASGMFSGTTIHVFSGLADTLPGIHVSIWLLFPIAAVVTAIFGVLLGAPTLRLRGDYLAIVTLGFGEIIPKLFQNGDDIFGHNLTNGTRGISGLDTPTLGGGSVDAILGPGWGIWGPLNLLPWYYLGLLLCIICWYVSVQMQWSKLGRAWMAIREDETAASAMGINLVSTKLWAYGIGAALGGMAGVYHGARIGSIFPASFQFYISISLLCMVIIGGMGNVWGAVLGAITIEGLNFWLLPSMTGWVQAAGIDVDLTSWNMLIFGVLLVVMMLFRPQGFIASKARVIDLPDDEPDDRARSQIHVDTHGPAPARALHDAQPGSHVAHYPAALQGPQAHQHPVLESGIPRPGAMHSRPVPQETGHDSSSVGVRGVFRSAPNRDGAGSAAPRNWPGAPRFPRFGQPQVDPAIGEAHP
jgi:branched-chain amino acid transport system permease protein